MHVRIKITTYDVASCLHPTTTRFEIVQLSRHLPQSTTSTFHPVHVRHMVAFIVLTWPMGGIVYLGPKVNWQITQAGRAIVTLITIYATKSEGLSNLLFITYDAITKIQSNLSYRQIIDGTNVYPLGNLFSCIVFVDPRTNFHEPLANVLHGLSFTCNASYTVFTGLAQIAHQTTFPAASFIEVMVILY